MKALVQPISPRPARDSFSAGSALAEIGVLPKETLGDRVAGELRALLMAGKLAPGEKLSLRKVAEAIGVSMMPVREAISRLAADGALEVLPGRAVRVPIMSLSQFRELTRIRLVLEGFAAEEAARNASEADAAAIAEAERIFREAAESTPPNSTEAVTANHKLHATLYRAAGMPTLVEMIERLWLRAGPVLNLDMRSDPDRLKGGSAVQAHAALLVALRARDDAGARRAIEADISAAAAHIARTGGLADD